MGESFGCTVSVHCFLLFCFFELETEEKRNEKYKFRVRVGEMLWLGRMY